MTKIEQGARQSMNDARTCTQSDANLAHDVPEAFSGRFRISWVGGAYYVSVPNYRGGDAVSAQVADALVKALDAARMQLVTLGGDATGPDADRIQAFILSEIDTALAAARGEA